MINFEDNPIRRAFIERYNQQSTKVKFILDKLADVDYNKYQLNLIKRKRPNIEKGDIFLINPFDDIYFYGLVLNTDVSNINGDNFYVICIFKNYTYNFTTDEDIPAFSEDNLLLKPCIVTKTYWNKGYFYNLNKKKELQTDFDFGFYRIGEDEYVNEYGISVNHIPSYVSAFGIMTMMGIAYELYYELVIDNSFLRDADRKKFIQYIEKAVEE